MMTVIGNTPSGLIPKELFKEENIQEYWNVLYATLNQKSIGVDEFDDFFLIYPKPKDIETTHEISLMYKNMREKFSKQADAICFNVYEKSLSLLVLKEMKIAFTGYFTFSVEEDMVYHLANVAQHFFEDISQITFYYKHLSSKVLHFLKKYFQMKQF